MMSINSSQPLAILILAGGKSTRMGQDKALISLDGTPFLKRVCEMALSLSNSVLVVTPWVERYQDVIPTNCQIFNEIQPSETETQGPLVGFWRGWQQIESDWVLALACDLPQLKAEMLQHWSQDLVRMPPNTIAYLPKNIKGWEPLCGFYHQRGKPNLDQYLQQGGRSFQGWLNDGFNRNLVQEIPVPESEYSSLLNCNTPEDLSRINDL